MKRTTKRAAFRVRGPRARLLKRGQTPLSGGSDPFSASFFSISRVAAKGKASGPHGHTSGPPWPSRFCDRNAILPKTCGRKKARGPAGHTSGGGPSHAWPTSRWPPVHVGVTPARPPFGSSPRPPVRALVDEQGAALGSRQHADPLCHASAFDTDYGLDGMGGCLSQLK